jgi:stalled ribosome alternative rescue factor ArfA
MPHGTIIVEDREKGKGTYKRKLFIINRHDITTEN